MDTTKGETAGQEPGPVALTEQQREVIGLLIQVARCAYHALDNSEEVVGTEDHEVRYEVCAEDAEPLFAALAALDELDRDDPLVHLSGASTASLLLLG